MCVCTLPNSLCVQWPVMYDKGWAPYTSHSTQISPDNILVSVLWSIWSLPVSAEALKYVTQLLGPSLILESPHPAPSTSVLSSLFMANSLDKANIIICKISERLFGEGEKYELPGVWRMNNSQGDERFHCYSVDRIWLNSTYLLQSDNVFSCRYKIWRVDSAYKL